MSSLIHESRDQLDSIFTRTYGVLYERNSILFTGYFRDLENYYKRGRLDLERVSDRFFAELYKKMFQVRLNITA